MCGWCSSGGGGGRISFLINTNTFSGSVTRTGGSEGGVSGTLNEDVYPNVSPNSPSSLGGHVSGDYIGDNTPTLTFTLSDGDAGDTVKYQIQIDNNSDFSSAVVDYASALAAQGSFSFTIGQAAGSGSYTTGSEGQTLSADDYYWQVKAIDSSSSSSAFVKGNSGEIAFKVDGTAPSTPGTASSSSLASDVTPTWTWTASTDSGAGLSSTPYTVQWCTNTSYTGCDSNTATSSSNSYTQANDLTEGLWYFRVKAVDEVGNESSYSSNGSFTVDITGPSDLSLDSPSSDGYINQTRPSFKWKVPTDSLSGLSSYTLEVDNGDEGNFSITGIPTTASSFNIHETSKYKATYIDFDDGNSDNDYIELQTKSTSDWSSTENNGELKQTKVSWTVKAIDNASNESSSQQSVYIDNSSPQLSNITLNGTSVSDAMATNQNTFTLAGRVTDALAGIYADTQFASGVESVGITIKKKSVLGFYTTYLISNANLGDNYWASSNEKIDNNNEQISNKHADFSSTLSINIPNGDYKVTISGRDKAGNYSNASFTVIVGPQAVFLAELEIDEEEEEVVTKVTPTPITKAIEPPKESKTKETVEKVIQAVKTAIQNISKAVQQLNQYVKTAIQGLPEIPKSIITAIINIFEPIKSATQKTKIKLVSTFEIWFSIKPTNISGVKVKEAGDDYVIITWKTNHYATSKVSYGDSYDYGQDIFSRIRTREHEMIITNLEPGKVYYYEVMSEGKNYAFDARHEFMTTDSSSEEGQQSE